MRTYRSINMRRGVVSGGVQSVLGLYSQTQSTDTTTSSTSFVAFGAGTSVAVSPNTRFVLWISGGVSADTNNRTVTFDLRFNGVSQGIFSVFCDTANREVAISYNTVVTGLTPGPNTFQLFWKTDGGVAQCRALTVPGEHMEAILMEISV